MTSVLVSQPGTGKPPAHRRGRADATSVLTGYVVLLTAIPSVLVFAPLGAAGTPAQMLGMLFLLVWCADWLSRPHASGQPLSPVRRALLLFSTTCLVSYLVAAMRPTEGVEMRAADRGMLTLCAWLGIVLVADVIPSRARLEVLLRRLVTATTCVALLGIVQFITGKAWTDRLVIPGLSFNTQLSGVIARVGFARPAGTAVHPIEFGVVLTMALPLALHFAYHDVHRPLLRRCAPPAAIAMAVPLSISRSALLAGLVIVLFLLPTWSRTRRRHAYGLLLALGGATYVMVPGLLGALKGLFLGIGQDSSAQSRTDSYVLVGKFIARNPLFGRGIGTFLPSYRILDNQYLGTAIETGLIGLAALLVLLGAGVITARSVRKRSPDPAAGDLAQSLAAGIAAGSLSLATFDGLAFPMVAGILFLLLGSTAALWKLIPDRRSEHPAHPLLERPRSDARAPDEGGDRDPLRSARDPRGRAAAADQRTEGSS